MKRILSIFLTLALLLGAFAAVAETTATAAPTLKLGAKGDAVAALQARLIELGFLSGEADGEFGAKTESAVRDLQTCLAARGYEISVDGIVGVQTVQLLYDASCLESLRMVAKGDKGGQVRELQARLIELGYLFGSADGSFGQKTEDALQACQRALMDAGAQGLTATGVLDAATRELLYSDLSGYSLATPVFYTSDDPENLQAGHLYAEACILVDADTGEVLFEKNADERMYPASTTKIMTLLLALESVDADEVVTLPEETNKIPSDSSRVPVYAGEQMPMRDLLYGLMIKSGNDAANAIATLVSGSTEEFAGAMNRKAAALGMTDTHFANPHGYHSKNHYTTARDMAVLTCAALKTPEFLRIVSTKTYTMSATARRGALKLENGYAILNPDSKYYYRGAFGIKTGYTSSAGQCYVGAATHNGRTLIAVVLNSGIAKTDKWKDTARLFDYGFAISGL